MLWKSSAVVTCQSGDDTASYIDTQRETDVNTLETLVDQTAANTRI